MASKFQEVTMAWAQATAAKMKYIGTDAANGHPDHKLYHDAKQEMWLRVLDLGGGRARIWWAPGKCNC